MTASAWSPNPATVTQANANGTVKQEVQVASAGQRVFNIASFAYAVGTGSLKVYVNGKVLARNDDFIEVNSAQVALVNGCNVGDKVLIEGFVGIIGSVATDATLRADIAANSGANLVGFLQKGINTIKQSVQSLFQEKISLSNYGTGIGQGNTAADTSAFLLAISAVAQAYNAKGSACLEIPIPTVPYQINQTLDFTEVWNFSIKVGNGFFYQRQQALNVLTDNALIAWYGDAVSPMIRLNYTFGFHAEGLSLNGRGIAKIGIAIAPPVLGAGSVTRKVVFNDLGIKNCDFGIVIGDLAGQTDNAPVILNRPTINGCTSTAILVNSGNAGVGINDPFLANNGYAPTLGNAFIADAANIGTHMTILAGFVNINNWISDHDVTHVIAGCGIYQTNGSIKINGGWFDDPNKPMYRGWADRGAYFNGVNHYDGSMTLASTLNSIEYNGAQTLVLESCYLYGNVQITSGNQASVISQGTTFVRAGAGFTGDMVTNYGGLVHIGKTGANSVAMAVGGPFPADFTFYHSLTAYSDKQRPGIIRRTRGASPYTVVETIDAVNGVWYVSGNAYFNADSGQWLAVAAGPCWRHTYKSGTELLESFVAAAVGSVITWQNPHGFIPGTGGNAIPKVQFSDRTVTYEAAPPADGTGTQGSIVFNLSAASGGYAGWICTGAGKIWKTFGLIS